MADSFKKVLLGAVVGALLVGFVWHIRLERAKHEPAAMGPASGGRPAAASGSGGAAPQGKGGAPGGSASQMPVGVVVAPVRVEQLALQLEALGTAHANESVDVTSKVSNLITAVHFAEGQQVRRGDLLAELDGEQARADLAVAEAALTESRSQYDRSRELYSTKVLSQSQLDQIEATLKANEARVAYARSRVGDTQIRAPFAGRVGLRRVSVGSLVNPGTVITTLDDTSTIKLDFTIPETFLSDVTPGLVIAARSVAYPGQTFDGKVASVDSRVDPSTRSVTVRALLPNPKGLLKPGMFLTVLLSRGAAAALVVPEQALVPEQGDVFVFVVKDGVAEKRLVKTGQRRVGEVQVVHGLAAGESVVTEGTQKLRNGAAVKVVQATGAAPAAAVARP
ncbi:MAG: efflux RND transporter periplasmic adaptor subunit [Gammaproteobacteria bacterium]|nr:efflux RND transporter periplasmic adaptor subunit [Gammaproteobacteria bacterium]